LKILPYRRYWLLIRSQGYERAWRCFNLQAQGLSPEEAAHYQEAFEKKITHLFSFRDTEQVHTYLGILKGDSPEKTVFETPEGREFEFRPLFPEREKSAETKGE
jgi:hypothetical protein